MITDSELRLFSPLTPISLIPIVSKWFNEYEDKYEVNTTIRIASFFAQIIHESGSFRYSSELASGSAYEGRKDLGNINVGDGKKFKGRGYIQITGRINYTTISQSLFQDDRLLSNPEILATPQYAMLSAFWFWQTRNLNELADKNFQQIITKRINGGLNGWPDRLANYNRICDILNLPHWSE